MSPRIPALTAAVLAGGLLLSAGPAAAAVTAPGSAAAPALAVSAAAAVSASASFVASGSAAAPASAAASVSASAAAAQWSVAPANADGPDGRISLRHTIDPGGSATDAIAVTNLGAEPATYTVAAGDGVVGDDGAFDIAAGAPEDSGAWITVEGAPDGTVAVAPGETRVLPLRIDVPADVVPGDHPAGIVVGVSAADDGVTVTNRIGVRVHLQVAGDIVPALGVGEVSTTFSPSWIPFAPGTLRVETVVTNTGNVRLGALAAVSGPGITSASLTGDAAELLPGDSTTVVTETSSWPILVLFGSTQVRPVALGDDAITAPAPVDADFVAAAPSWTGLALLVLLAGAVTALVLRRRRHPATPDATEPETVDATRETAAAGTR
ncbi:hypothetical protein ACFWZW_09545 [Microbacterium enclense]|uniref:hypothetical protein n=1 Tax=Microbacterium enclense TaxID=993073 RepID=UPI0036DBC424